VRKRILTETMAHALGRSADDSLVLEAVIDVALGMTIRLEGFQYSKISDTTLAITDPTGETQLLDLDSGTYH
jgi:hypothetical protein